MTQEVKSCNQCNRVLPIDQFHLKGGGTRRHNCKDCRREESKREWIKQGAYRTYKRQAPERGYTFEIEKEDFDRLVRLPCYYCGDLPIDDNIHGLDRTNNMLSYTLSNVVPCCSKCNFMKGTLDKSEFIQQTKKIAEKHTFKKTKIHFVEEVWGRKVYTTKSQGGELKQRNFIDPVW